MRWDNEREDSGEKSRSQKKRESAAVQKIGETLANLAESDLRKLAIPGELLDAILEWKRFPGHEAKRRQMQYIGRVMRDMDIEKLETLLEDHLAPSREKINALHAVETLRDQLVNAPDGMLDRELAALAERHPFAPTALLRHCAVTAKQERAAGKPPRAYRKLFKLLQRMIAQEEEGDILRR